MARVRISTTVDGDLLATARRTRAELADSALIDEALRGIPSEVPLDPSEDPVPRSSVVNLDSVESVSLGTLVERLGRLSDERMHEICAALETAVACDA